MCGHTRSSSNNNQFNNNQLNARVWIWIWIKYPHCQSKLGSPCRCKGRHSCWNYRSGHSFSSCHFLGKEKKDQVVSDTTVIGTDDKAEIENQPVERKELPTREEAHELEEQRRVLEVGNNKSDVTYELPSESDLPLRRGGVKSL